MQGCKINITTPSQVLLVATNLLEICCTALSSIKAHHWFLADLIREAAQTTLKAYEQLFFSSANHGETTSRALARICTAMSTLATAYGFEAVAASCWTRLLLYRIESGPNSAWDKAERTMTATLRSSGFSPPDHADFQPLLKGLQRGDWEDGGESLRVCMHILPRP